MGSVNVKRQLTRCACVAAAITAGFAPAARCQTVDPLNILEAPVTAKSAVRFYYDSAEAYTFPLVFRVVPPDNPRLNTMPFLREGWIAYITQPEMGLLLKGLSGLGVRWKETPKMIPLGPGFPGPLTDAAVITVLSSRGTATGEIHPPIRNYDPSAICEKLLPLQSSLIRLRARWEFEWTLSRWGCKVPGFDRDAFSLKGQKTVW